MNPTPYLIASLLSLSCATSIETFPQHNKCVFDSQRRLVGRGSVIARNAEGAYLFQFSDPTQGDRGFLWIGGENATGRYIAPCKSDSQFDAQYDREPERP